VLFGPAYKGINICLATSIALFQKYNILIPFSYNRKVDKTYGEGGQFIGYDLTKANNILVLDDVITNGGTKYEVIHMFSLDFPNIKINAIIVGVDRQEKDSNGKSYRIKFIEDTGVNVMALTTKTEVLKFKNIIQ
jgi:orotate phosphoribosyltransferase